MHGAFENSAKQTQWNIEKLLSHLYKFFKQAPARRTFLVQPLVQSFSLKVSVVSDGWKINPLLNEQFPYGKT